jgi:peptidoglycan/LPS O-acetylase OafA/YrhL
MRPQLLPSPHHQRLFAAAAIWLCLGSLLLLTTLVPAYTGLLGWTTTFWLLAAPMIVLLALEPQLPRRLLMRRRSRRVQAIHGVVWY